MAAWGGGVGTTRRAGPTGHLRRELPAREPRPSPWTAGGPSFLLLEGSGLTVSFTRRVLLLPEQWWTEASTASQMVCIRLDMSWGDGGRTSGHRRTGGQHSRKRERELAKGAETDQKLEILNGLNVQSVSIVS